MALSSVAEVRERIGDARRGLVVAAAVAFLGLSAWALILAAAVVALIRLTGDPLIGLALAALILLGLAGVVLIVATIQRRRARKAREMRQARRAIALTTALALMSSRRTGSLATVALAVAGLGLAFWPRSRS